jgi:transposase
MPAPSYDELREQNRRLLEEVRACRAEIAQLRQTVEQLTAANAKLLEALEQTQRRGKRQAAPFSKGDPSANPKRPGRKPGEKYGAHARRPAPAPESIHETHDAPLPEACPQCGGGVLETDVAQQYQVEIPRQPIQRQFHVHIGHCQQCGKRVQGRHPLQTSDALGAAASQLGPDVQAAIGVLNKQAGLSHGKIERIMEDLFGIDIARSTSVRTTLRVSAKLEPTYEQIGAFLKQQPMVVLDETGWRVGGHKAWLHVAVDREAAYYAVAPDRSGAFAEDLLGIDWPGTMLHDGWSPYDNFRDAAHQQCVAHALRRAKEILEAAPGAAVRFPRQVLDLFKEALELKDRFRASRAAIDELEAAAEAFDQRLERLTRLEKAYLPNEKFAAHLRHHAREWFIFLLDPAIEATNWLAEQAVRVAVVNRKVWGGNRTWNGARAQGVLSSVIQTCRKQAAAAVDFISQTLRGLSPLIVTLPTR